MGFLQCLIIRVFLFHTLVAELGDAARSRVACATQEKKEDIPPPVPATSDSDPRPQSRQSAGKWRCGEGASDRRGSALIDQPVAYALYYFEVVAKATGGDTKSTTLLYIKV